MQQEQPHSSSNFVHVSMAEKKPEFGVTNLRHLNEDMDRV